MAADPPPSTRKQLRARVARYARLRAAQRALAAAAPLPASFDTGARARVRLRALEDDPEVRAGDASAPASAAWKESLAGVDAALGAYAEELRGAAEAIPGARIRATLPPLLGEDRPALLGLLDLCLADKRGERARWLSLTDYLVTLLVSEVAADGTRRVASDPTRLTARLRRLSSAWGEHADPEAAALAAELREACEALAAGDEVGDVIERVKRAKERAGDRFFDPALLRAAIAYNVAAFNRLRSQSDLERVQDQVFCEHIGVDGEQALPDTGESADGDLQAAPVPPAETPADPPAHAEPLPGRAAPEPPAAAPPAPEVEAVEPEPLSGSVFDARGVRLLEEALTARLYGGARPSESDGPAERLAHALPAVKLAPWERVAFAKREPGRPVRALRIASALRLAREIGGDAAPLLTALGLDPRAAPHRWIRELDEAIQEAITASLGSGCYDEARQLQHTKARLPQTGTSAPRLAPPIRRSTRKRTGARASERSFDELSGADRSAPAAARDAGSEQEEEKQALGESVRRLWQARPAWQVPLAAAAVGLLVLGALQWKGSTPEAHAERAYYSAAELAELPTPLLEGFMVERGRRQMFVAVVSPGWHRLASDDREAEARVLYEMLRPSGVNELVLLDESRAVEIQIAESGVLYSRE